MNAERVAVEIDRVDVEVSPLHGWRFLEPCRRMQMVSKCKSATDRVLVRKYHG